MAEAMKGFGGVELEEVLNGWLLMIVVIRQTGAKAQVKTSRRLSNTARN